MNVYKVKYLPLNLYFTPSRYVKVNTERPGSNYKKCNLSKKGKAYTRYPSHFSNAPVIYYKGDEIKTKFSDWLIEEYKLKPEEINTEE